MVAVMPGTSEKWLTLYLLTMLKENSTSTQMNSNQDNEQAHTVPINRYQSWTHSSFQN